MATETQEGTEAPGHEGAGGLPQFDVQWWPGQIVWFLIIFTVIFLLMRLVFVPKIGGTIEARDGKIEGDIAEARRLRDEANAQAEAAAADTAQARASAQRLAAEAKAKAGGEAKARQDAEEAKLAATLAKAEADIAAARDQAMTSVRGIAAETASAIVERLTGKAPTTAEIDAGLAGRA